MNKAEIIAAIFVCLCVGEALAQEENATSLEQAREQVSLTAKSEGFGPWLTGWIPNLSPLVEELDKQCQDPTVSDHFYAYIHLTKDGRAEEVILDSKQPLVTNQFEEGGAADALSSYRSCFVRVARAFKYPDIPRDDFWITLNWESAPEGANNAQ